jgi:hypothetical protein
MGFTERDTPEDTTYVGVHFGFWMHSTQLLIRHNQATVVTGAWTPGDRFGVVWDGYKVRYYQNGNLLYTGDLVTPFLRAMAALAYPYPITSISYDPLAKGATGPGMWTPNMRGGIIQLSSRSFRKAYGTTGWNADLYSSEAFDKCLVEFSAPYVVDAMVGLNTDPVRDQSYASIDYGFIASGDGNVYIYESAASVQPCGAYSASTKFKITYDGTTVRYYLNEALVRSVYDPGKVFYLDSALYSINDQIDNVRFGAMLVGTEFLAGTIKADRLSVGAAPGGNLLINGNCEDGYGSDPVGYKLKHSSNNGALALVTGGLIGSKCLRTTGSLCCFSSRAVPVIAGQKYVLKFSYRGSIANLICHGYVGLSTSEPADGYNGYPDSGLWAFIPGYGDWVTPDTAWRTIEVVYEIPAGYSWISYGLHGPWGNGAGDYVDWDDISIRRITSGVDVEDGTLHGNKIVAGTIITGHMQANTINGDRIAAATINGNKIIANSVTANEVATNAINSRHLLIKSIGAALNSDPDCLDGNAWHEGSGGGPWGISSCSAQGLPAMEGDGLLFGQSRHIVSQSFAVSPSKKYTARMWVTRGGSQPADGYAYLRFYWYNRDGAQVGYTEDPNGGIPGTGWELRQIPQTTPPAGAVLCEVWVLLAWGGTGYQFAQGVRAEEVIEGVLIADGSITAPKIVAGSVTADHVLIKGNRVTLNIDPNLEDLSQWEGSGANPPYFSTDTTGPTGNRVMHNLTGDASYACDKNYYPIDRSRKYRVRFWAKVAGANGILYFSLRQYQDNAGTLCAENGGRSPYKPAGVTVPATWQEYSYEWGPADWQTGMRFVRLDFLLNYQGTAGEMYVQGIRFEEMVSGELIVDGAITAAKINTTDLFAQAITLNSGGYIQSTGFASGSSGFKISANGSAEFYNVTIRGSLTLGTSDFIANSTGNIRILAQNPGSAIYEGIVLGSSSAAMTTTPPAGAILGSLNMNGTFGINISSVYGTGNGQDWDHQGNKATVQLRAASTADVGITLGAKNSGNNYAGIYANTLNLPSLTISVGYAGVPYSNVLLEMGTNYVASFYATPGYYAETTLGNATYKWIRLYAKSKAGFFWSIAANSSYLGTLFSTLSPYCPVVGEWSVASGGIYGTGLACIVALYRYSATVLWIEFVDVAGTRDHVTCTQNDWTTWTGRMAICV